MPRGGASLHGCRAICKRVLRVLHPQEESVRMLAFTPGVVAAFLMGFLEIMGAVVLVELAGAVGAIEAVAFTGT